MLTNKKLALGVLAGIILMLGCMKKISADQGHLTQLTVGFAICASVAGSDGNHVSAGIFAVGSAIMYDMTKASALTLGFTGIGLTLTAGFAL